MLARTIGAVTAVEMMRIGVLPRFSYEHDSALHRIAPAIGSIHELLYYFEVF
jgi:hypothetical protein